MTLNVVFYCSKLKKKIPGTLKKNYIHKEYTPMKKNLYATVIYDFSKFDIFCVTRDEVYRYSHQVVNIREIYPYNTQAEKDYADYCIPNLTLSDITEHKENELDRYETLITELIDIPTLNANIFFTICEFLSYDILFNLCDLNDRLFYQNLTITILTEQPDPLRVPQMIRLLKLLFSKFTLPTILKQFKISDYNHYEEFSYLNLPVVIDIIKLKTNVEFITP